MSTVMEQAQNIISCLNRRHANNLSKQTSSMTNQIACGSISASRECKSLVGRIEVGVGLVSEPRISAPAAASASASRFSKYYHQKIANLGDETAYTNSGTVQSVSALCSKFSAADLITLTAFRQKNEFGSGLS